LENNSAAWLMKQKAPLEVGPAPLRELGNNEVLVRNYAVAINPVDWIMQYVPKMITPWVKLPFILGSDVAGEIVAVGKGVTRFQVGDRVLGHATGLDKARNDATEGGFQRFTVLLEQMASPIPQTLSYEDACVLPLGLSTAACGLFQKDQLALQHPLQHATTTGETLLVWGGSTSVGCNAIQLGKAAGYEVIATASPRNFAYLRELGAAEVYDYKNARIVSALIEALHGKRMAGAIAIGTGSAEACFQVIAASQGNKAVAVATGPLQFDRVAAGDPLMREMIRQTPAFWRFGIRYLASRMRGVRSSFIWGSSLMHNEVGSLIYRDFLPEALAEQRFRPAPPPVLAGKGLAAIQDALERQRKGVSAAKIVVSIP
jgi:NADPH:quinone reductase-like Zn-dependent oxidoreductase